MRTMSASCTYGESSDVTITVGIHVAITLSCDEAIQLIKDLQDSIAQATEMRNLELFLDRKNELDARLAQVCTLA